MAKKYIWTEEYSVKVKEIDEQHKEFFNIINALLEAVEDSSMTAENLLVKLGLLGDYALYHLSTEEDYFDKLKYPDAADHLAAHKQFREEAQLLFNNARSENVDVKALSQKAAEFAGDWLQHHILVTDKKYTEFFNEHNLK